jgi:MFS transporter, DHA1 family, multidrug resistance protein
MNFSFFRLAVLLGLLYAIGPFAVDMYLPALPTVGLSLGSDAAGTQMSLTSYFLALGLSQVFYGPASDMWGRKKPLYAGMGLFTLASIGCACATSMEALVLLRFVQGVGAGAGMTLPRAIVRDLHTGHTAARLTSLLMLVFSISPILAPLVGSYLSDAFGWRSVFWFVTGAGVAGLGLIALALPETRLHHERSASSMASAWASYVTLFKDRHFMGLTLISAFGMASFFVYLANSSFVLINHFGLIPRHYGYAFSMNAGAFIGAAQFTGMLTQRFGLQGVVKAAVVGFVSTLGVLVLTQLAGVDRLDVLLGLLFVSYAFLGLIVPITTVLALEKYGQSAGTASALLGTFQLLTGGVIMAVVGLFFDGTALPMVLGVTLCAALTAVFTLGTLGWGKTESSLQLQ